MQRYDGEVRVTDRVSGASVRVVTTAMLAQSPDEGDSVVNLEIHTAGSEIAQYVDCDSVAEMRALLRAFDAILSHLPTERPADFAVVERNWRGPEPCNYFGESTVYDDDAD